MGLLWVWGYGFAVWGFICTNVGDYIDLGGGIEVLNTTRLERSVNMGKIEELLGYLGARL